MKLMAIRENGYLVNLKRSKNESDSLECIVELTSDEIDIIHEYPDLTFEYIYNDMCGKNCVLYEFGFDASNYDSAEETIDALCKWCSYSVTTKRIFSLKDLVHWRFNPRIEHGTDGCVCNSNKIRKLERVYLKPNEGERWLKDNTGRIMNEITKWAAHHLNIFKKKEDAKNEI